MGTKQEHLPLVSDIRQCQSIVDICDAICTFKVLIPKQVNQNKPINCNREAKGLKISGGIVLMYLYETKFPCPEMLWKQNAYP